MADVPLSPTASPTDDTRVINDKGDDGVKSEISSAWLAGSSSSSSIPYSAPSYSRRATLASTGFELSSLRSPLTMPGLSDGSESNIYTPDSDLWIQSMSDDRARPVHHPCAHPHETTTFASPAKRPAKPATGERRGYSHVVEVLSSFGVLTPESAQSHPPSGANSPMNIYGLPDMHFAATATADSECVGNGGFTAETLQNFQRFYQKYLESKQYFATSSSDGSFGPSQQLEHSSDYSNTRQNKTPDDFLDGSDPGAHQLSGLGYSACIMSEDNIVEDFDPKQELLNDWNEHVHGLGRDVDDHTKISAYSSTELSQPNVHNDFIHPDISSTHSLDDDSSETRASSSTSGSGTALDAIAAFKTRIRGNPKNTAVFREQPHLFNLDIIPEYMCLPQDAVPFDANPFYNFQ